MHKFEWDFPSFSFILGCEICHLPTVTFYHYSLAVILLLIRLMLTLLPVPSCDAPKVQLSWTNTYWTSTVFRSSCCALGEKQSLLGHSSSFQGIYRLRTCYSINHNTQRYVHLWKPLQGPETVPRKKAFRVGRRRELPRAGDARTGCWTLKRERGWREDHLGWQQVFPDLSWPCIK